MKRLTLILSLLLAACAATPSLPPIPTEQPVPSVTAQGMRDAPATIEPSPTPQQPVPQATSRGNQLVASDPSSVQIGAGKPVLIEFFRFT